MEPAARRRFFASYVQTVTRRDIPEISGIRNAGELPRILQMLAASTAQEVRDVKMAERLSIDRRTLRANYMPLLQASFLTLEIPAWSRNLVSRVAKHPKNFLVDSGLAASLLRVDPQRLSRSTAPGAGALLEAFVVNELIRQSARFGDELGVALFHYRSHNGGEVDLIAEADDGRVVGIEIKAAQVAEPSDARFLGVLRDRLDALDDSEFVRGVVFHTGNRAYGLADRIDAVPIAALWLP